jgi:hypothetical protein
MLNEPYAIIEVVNKYGFTDWVFEDQPNMPVCACCSAYKMPNRGGGTACETCQHEDFLECQHDYDQGWL